MKPIAYEHQTRVLATSKDASDFALLMEQGTGKTRVVIDTAEHLFRAGKIRAMLVIAPNGVSGNWVINEIPLHMEIPRCAVTWEAARSGTKAFTKRMATLFASTSELKVLSMNVEAMSTPRGRDVARLFVDFFKGDVLMVVDESAKIKTISAKRTKAILALGKRARYRRILTGTPVTQSPLDVYAQFAFLDPKILGFSSYYAFKAHYATIVKRRATDGSGRTYEYDDVIGYRHLDELRDAIKTRSFRVTKDECLDLPTKIYTNLVVEMSQEQRRRYDCLRRDLVLQTASGAQIPVPMMLTRLLRFQQITGGFVPDETETSVEPIPGPNPKLQALVDDVEEIASGGVIVWARFRAEIELIVRTLREIYGFDKVGAYYGGISGDERAELIENFQCGRVRFFVGNAQSAGLGLTLTAASTVYYFSNDFSCENRLQSEDRCHRIGQTRHVVYKDIACRGTVDDRVLEVLKQKKDVAAVVLGDPIALVGGDEF